MLGLFLGGRDIVGSGRGATGARNEMTTDPKSPLRPVAGDEVAGRGAVGCQVTVISAYRFHMFALARELYRRDALLRLITATPRRTIDEVPPSAIRARPWLALVRHASTKLRLPVEDRLIRVVLADFDRWASTQLPDSPVVTALSACATNTLSKAASRGSRIVCERGSWHILEQKRVLHEEADRWGWPRGVFDPWVVDRELTEYDIVDRIFVPSSAAQRSFVRLGIPAARVARVSFGADLSTFSPPENDQRDRKRVLCVAQVGLQKGHQYLVPAYRRVRRPGSKLVLIGDAAPAVVKRLGVPEDDIEVVGTVARSRVAQEMRAAGIFVLASVHDGLALVIAQAMASGLPVVASEATGAEDLITDGVEGFIVPPRDGDRLAEAIDKLMSDPELAQSMGAAGRRRIETLGGWDDYGRTALGEFSSVLT